MVLHSDFPALPLRCLVMQVKDRSFEYHPKKADGTRDESVTKKVNRRIAMCQFSDCNATTAFCIVYPCRDWPECSFDGLVGASVIFAVTEVQEDRDTTLPIFRISGFEVQKK